MYHHVTVLKNEAVEGLNIKENGIYVDCTLGGAGHSLLIAARLTGEQARLICVDQDDRAIEQARQSLATYLSKVTLVKSNFRHLEQILVQQNVEKVDGFLYDLGVSSPQLDDPERGFSYNHDADLDMRMNQESSLTAYELINESTEEELARIIAEYGEERFAKKIALNIVERRKRMPIKRTLELVEVIKESIPAKFRRDGPHPAKRTFQAIRIAVNDELKAFEESLAQAVDRLSSGGRICVITFHSLEDRICKQFFQKKMQSCLCPPGFPQCVCGHEPELKLINRKPILPNPEEIKANPRARSAKLRIAEKL